MKQFFCSLLLLPFFFSHLSCKPKQENGPLSLKVMSFNIWHGGGKSVEATGRVFFESGADIIGVQESFRDEKNMAVYLADSLGWYSSDLGGGRSVVSRYPIIGHSANRLGVKIQLSDNQFVWMFNVHLMYCPYEPYQLNGIHYCGAPLLATAEEAIASALSTRKADVEMNISDILEVRKEGYPIFLTGDFNEPSCLDWTAKAVEAELCKLPVVWPSTQAFMEKGGLIDSYRTFYTDEVEQPGYTWTPIPETEAYVEVMDRIDFVFYSGGEKIQLVNAQLVGEEGPGADISFADFPSDHRAVLSSFVLF
ncbi:endonuclease/exonuclease/phosphatase family protein [Parabacteroides sp. PF5-9]|uniref:endonuclease/exonuclease/phosphatase family protein n=1 Tax=Parabacteroides sp. PF5-9 TaxID=1742404 RepID=UPI00247624AE|nr:endonuclease/exonuclease/phosphatase family protein [Parabacteroides sp. PF5-9]MDH6358660.1 exodeoxyribonuclease-3 [Parabacteroides sp. PF5-9]